MEAVEQDEHRSVALLLHDFFGYTSMHGAGRIVASRHLIRKTFWIISILGCLAVVSWQVHDLHVIYRKRPLATHVQIAHNTSLHFPAITICGMNALRINELNELESLRGEFVMRSLLNTSDYLQRSSSGIDALKRFAGVDGDEDEKGEEDEGNEEDEGEEQDKGDEGDELDKPDESDVEDDDDGIGGEMEAEFLDREHLRTIMARQDPDKLRAVGHQFEDFVVYCTYRGVYCANYSGEFWSHFWHFAYGNCYVFNGGTTESGLGTKVFKSSEPGPSYGLSLELNIEQKQYIGALTPEAGVRIHISNQGEMPFPLDKGLSLAPGYATSIGMRKVLIKRKDPFSENLCVSDSASDMDNIYKQKMKMNYSSTACKKSCWASYQRKLCGCMEYKFPRLEDTPVCNIANKTVAKCLTRVKGRFKRENLSCSNSCPPPCRETTFKLSTSYSLWPTEAYEAFYIAELRKRTKEVDGSDNFRANVLKVDIFYEELNYEVISEELSYELANFVSDLGGSLGLWIGMSVLSFAEIFELLVLICLSLGKKLKKGKNTKSSTVHVEEFKYR